MASDPPNEDFERCRAALRGTEARLASFLNVCGLSADQTTKVFEFISEYFAHECAMREIINQDYAVRVSEINRRYDERNEENADRYEAEREARIAEERAIDEERFDPPVKWSVGIEDRVCWGGFVVAASRKEAKEIALKLWCEGALPPLEDLDFSGGDPKISFCEKTDD